MASLRHKNTAGSHVASGEDAPLPVDDGTFPATWTEITAATDNAAATATKAAVAGTTHYITGVSAAFSAAVVGKLLEVFDGATVIYRTYVHSARDLTFKKALKGTSGAAVSATLAASGTAGQFGAVSISGYSRPTAV